MYMAAVSYDLQSDALESKVLVYSLVYTVISLIQIICVIYQMKHSSTQAMNAKTSLLTLFAHALLDAVICMGHLLVGAALPQVFFSSFIWIGILKLLLFSVFQMRLIINVYQARLVFPLAFSLL